ncbi:MAG: right-handed parallel beta-helix repeat-containing protein [Candidatus Omnitrophica bacterium]|nr:right-handed parallel beta-helix repeat-containing protein [Candidatus Omnitrophota bacterium]
MSQSTFRMNICATLMIAVLALVGGRCPSAAAISAKDYGSIQEAIDANPGKMIEVPEGFYEISEKIRISGTGGGLYGYGRIFQTNPEAAILEIEHATGVRIKDLTFTRPEGKMESEASGIFCWDNVGCVLDGVRILNNRSRSGSIEVRDCLNFTIRNCEVINYKRIAIDDRTGPDEPNYGYAFHCIDGTGIVVRSSGGTLIQNNRIVERNLFPTKEMKEKYQLGTLTEGKYPSKPGRLAGSAFRENYVNNWHQGSAMIVTSPKETHHTNIIGNYLENAAQGVDMHSDFITCSNNTINHCFIGLKMTHGCRNLIVTSNLVTHADKWGILMNPGAASHYAAEKTDDQEALPANVDAGTIIANNIVTDFGYGDEYWNWGGKSPEANGSYAIALFEGQFEENPPLRDILITGNIVYNTGRDSVLVDGKPEVQPPRYRYAVYAGPWGEGSEPKASAPDPDDLHFSNNIFHPGVKGISNIELTP